MAGAVLSPKLEATVLAAIVKGLVPPSTLHSGELSRSGQLVLASITQLRQTVEGPIELSSIATYVTDVLGRSRSEVTKLLKSIHNIEVGKEIDEVLQKVRYKQALVGLVNEASAQLSSGEFDLFKLTEQIQQTGESSDSLVSLADQITGKREMPEGPPIQSLPSLSEAMGGLIRFIVVGGPPEVGKSKLVMQFALAGAKEKNILYYDFENPVEDLDARLTKIFKTPKRAKKATQNIFFKDSVSEFGRDLLAVGKDSIIIIDSLQNLPTSTKDHRISLNKWIARLKLLSKRGYTIIATSEVGRGAYEDRVGQRDYKETGAIEYGVTVGIRMVPVKESGEVELHIVKNRNRPVKGLICYLEPDIKYGGWIYKEDAA